MIDLTNDLGNKTLKVPTEENEITKEWFDDILNCVELREHYAIVALLQNDTLFSVVNKGKNAVGVTPIVVKINESTIKDNVIGKIGLVDRTAIERAHHVYLPQNELSFGYIKNFIEANPNLKDKIYKGEIGGRKITKGVTRPTNVVMVEFKIMPVVDIVAFIDKNSSYIHHYLVDNGAAAN